MNRSLPLRERLALSFALALVLAYVAIAVCSVLVVNRALAGSIDARLRTVTQALVAIAGDQRNDLDSEDRAQFGDIAADAGGALVLATDGSLILGTIENVPAWVPVALRSARGRTDLYHVERRARTARARRAAPQARPNESHHRLAIDADRA